LIILKIYQNKGWITIISHDSVVFLMPDDKPIRRDEVISVLTLIFLFISVVGGREIGNYYASYQEMTRLKVLFEVSEEELSRYLIEIINGEETSLEIGLIISPQRADNPAGIVTETPDYIRRYMVGLTVSPVVVTQPSASDVELEMYIEDRNVHNTLYTYPKQKISYIRFTDRFLELDIDNIGEFSEIVKEASTNHGGEIAVTFKGRVQVHLLFLDTWLPYTVTRYPVIKAPHLVYVESGWRSYTSDLLDRININESGYILVDFKNPTRIHSLRENITCSIFRDDGLIMNITKNVQVPPGLNGQYIFPFTFTEPGEYTYRITRGDRYLSESSEILTVR
jgi:hypothetical protein